LFTQVDDNTARGEYERQLRAVEAVWLGAGAAQSVAVVHVAAGDIKEVGDYFFGYVAVVLIGSGRLVGEVLPVRSSHLSLSAPRSASVSWVRCCRCAPLTSLSPPLALPPQLSLHRPHSWVGHALLLSELETEYLESRAKAAARLDLEVSAE
jgi:hypothetical protein